MAACAFTGMLRRSRNSHAVELKLQAEKETRDAIIAAAIAGADAVVLEAIASDPPQSGGATSIATAIKSVGKAKV